MQVHCGFGDSDLHLWRADPAYLKPLIERFRETSFVLLHCYPFVREAGWLAHVYGNVWFDLSLTIPHVARPVEQVREALELAPFSKLLYASDAARTPELYFLGAKWWREALAEVLAEALPPDEAEEAGRAILRENALALYVWHDPLARPRRASDLHERSADRVPDRRRDARRARASSTTSYGCRARRSA